MLTLIVGCNHRTAPLDVRERLALSSDQARGALHVLRATYPQCEGLILSTCNRVELYLARPDDGPPDCQRAIELLAGFGQVDPSRLAGLVYAHTAADAIRHCFRVVSSLDSMVLGESQIVGQARQALVLAEQAEAARHLV